MKGIIILVLVVLIAVVTVRFCATEEPDQAAIDSVQRQAAFADARVALASTQEECTSLADYKFGEAVTLSMNYVGLKPDFQRVFQDGSGDQLDTPDNEQRKDLRAQFDSLGHSGLTVLMCLRHLDDQGIVPLGESVPAVAEQLEQSGQVEEQ